MDAVKLLGALMGSNATGGNLLGSILGGGGGGAQQGGGAAGLLGSILGGGGAQQQGGAGGILSSVLGGGGGGGGASSNILGGLLRGAMAKQMGGGGGGGGAAGLLGSLLGGGQPEPEPEPQVRQQANDQATILIRAMCNAAKSDGSVDAQEQENIVGRLGELDQGEIDFLKQELSSPLDVAGFTRSVPAELAPQVYALSVMTVKVDTREEVAYLQQLGQGLGLDNQTLAAIHQQAGLS